MPKKKMFPGILIELKSGKYSSPEHLEELAKMALNQMEIGKYDSEMKRQGVKEVVKYGVAFCGKKVEVVMETTSC